MEKPKQYITLPDFGKVPPQAIDIESLVLGVCLIYPDSIFDVRLASKMFYKEAHQKIFDSILEVAKSGNCDLATVTNHLIDTGQLGAVGGPVYLASLTNNVFTDKMIDRYSLIVKEKYLKREFIRVSAEIQNRAFDDSLLLDDLIDYSESELFALSDITQTNEVEKLNRVIDQQLIEIEKVCTKEKQLTGVPSGFLNIDRATGGWQEENLIIIASRPSMGKTALALALSQNAATLKYPVGLFSLEMSKKELAIRFLSSASNYTNVQIRNGEINYETLVNKSFDIAELPIYIDDTPAISLFELRSKAKKMILRSGVKLIIVDYLQLMKGEGESREQEVSKISRGLKAISKEFHIPIIALSQLNRKCEERKDKRPMLSDLRESGSIEQDADIVGLLWRPAYYDIRTVEIEHIEQSSEGVLFIDVAKNRNGATGDFVLFHNNSLTKIEDIKPELINTPY